MYIDKCKRLPVCLELLANQILTFRCGPTEGAGLKYHME